MKLRFIAICYIVIAV